jgi:hypothetical protein
MVAQPEHIVVVRKRLSRVRAQHGSAARLQSDHEPADPDVLGQPGQLCATAPCLATPSWPVDTQVRPQHSRQRGSPPASQRPLAP